MFKTIVVGTDGSEHGDRAVALAQVIAQPDASRVVVVHVTELVGGKGGVYPASADEADLRKKIESQVAELAADGIQVDLVTHTTRLGGPAQLIAEDAANVDADLIVVGSRGTSPVGQVVLGSVPVRLLHIAHRPVLVVPPPAG